MTSKFLAHRLRGAGLVLFEVVRGAGGPTPSVSQLAGYTASVGGFVAYTLIRVGGMRAAQLNEVHETHTHVGAREHAADLVRGAADDADAGGEAVRLYGAPVHQLVLGQTGTYWFA